ncbi:MAG: MFS transporter [Microthrixaceae bacterium]
MTTIHSQWVCDVTELQLRTRARDDVLVLEAPSQSVEPDLDAPAGADPNPPAGADPNAPAGADPNAPAGAGGGVASFELAAGPFRTYRRTISWEPTTSEEQKLRPDRQRHQQFRVEQNIDFTLAIPYWAWLFWLPVRRTLGEGPPQGRRLWWSTPDRLTSRQSSLVAAVSLLNMVSGVLYGLITQVLTFAAGDMGDGSRSEQTSLLAAVRIGVIVTMLAMVLADRIGRRKVAIGAFTASALLTLAAALSPNLWSLGALQFLSRNLAIAGLLCADTIAVEEMPPGSRAMVSSLGTLAYGLGAGLVVMTLPLADLGPSGWRLTFLIAGASLPIIWHVRRHLPESRRYTLLESRRSSELGAEKIQKIRPSRLILLGAIFLLLNVFLAPASQLQNDYLRTEVGFSGVMISVFVLLTSTPGGIGVLLGGRIADVFGRRWAIVPGLTAVAVFSTWFYASTNWTMWIASLAASVIGGMAAPALGVIAPELFPTARRGTVRGVITGLAVAGSVVGLVISGWLIDSRGYSVAFLALGVSALAAAMLAFALPETRGRELEEINR